jgi:hypothetical protein
VEALARIDRRTIAGQRDYALFSVIYYTGHGFRKFAAYV